MIRSPIVKVLSTIRKHGVKALLMGAQACVFYGAAEFSKDTDIVLLAQNENLAWLRAALDELEARQVYVPGLEIDALMGGSRRSFQVRESRGERHSPPCHVATTRGRAVRRALGKAHHDRGSGGTSV